MERTRFVGLQSEALIDIPHQPLETRKNEQINVLNKPDKNKPTDHLNRHSAVICSRPTRKNQYESRRTIPENSYEKTIEVRSIGRENSEHEEAERDRTFIKSPEIPAEGFQEEKAERFFDRNSENNIVIDSDNDFENSFYGEFLFLYTYKYIIHY